MTLPEVMSPDWLFSPTTDINQRFSIDNDVKEKAANHLNICKCLASVPDKWLQQLRVYQDRCRLNTLTSLWSSRNRVICAAKHFLNIHNSNSNFSGYPKVTKHVGLNLGENVMHIYFKYFHWVAQPPKKHIVDF